MTSIDAIDIIDLLPGELEAVLNSDEYFSDITVAVLEDKNVGIMKAALQAVITIKDGKRGVCVIIPQLGAQDPNNGYAYGPLDLAIALQVIEDVPANNGPTGTGKSARTVARRIRDVLKFHTPRGLVKNLRCDTPFLVPVPMEQAALAGYQCNFLALEDDGQAITKLGLPQFSALSGATPQTITITAAVGASLYYTLDGSHPWSGNPEAVLYTAPVAVTGGPKILRARAFLAGSYPSDTQFARFT